MTLLNSFHFINVVRFAIVTLTAGIKIFGPQKKFLVNIYDPSETFLFYELFFMSIQKSEHSETKVKLAVLTFTAAINTFGPQKDF